tara:strand:- start:19 stop:225 length:207 start_codon:yes stop_codon:yes gene_type:complete
MILVKEKVLSRPILKSPTYHFSPPSTAQSFARKPADDLLKHQTTINNLVCRKPAKVSQQKTDVSAMKK